MKITEVEINIQTGEETIKEIKLTPEQEFEILATREKHAQQQSQLEAENNAKKAVEEKLTKLGLTVDDLRALGL